VNWTIAAAVIDELYTDRKTRVLLDIVDCEDIAADVRQYAALAAATLLHASNESQEAAKVLAEHFLSGLPRHETNMYLLALAEQGMGISGLVSGSPKPKLPNHLISPKGFALADGVTSMYDHLRIMMFVDPSAKQWFPNEIASFPPDVKQFLSSVGRLAEMWMLASPASSSLRQQPNSRTW
jgi:hypothetical protein